MWGKRGSNIDLSEQVNCLNLLYALFLLPVYFLFRPDGSPEYYRVTPVLCSYDNHNSNKMIVHHLSIASKEITPISVENSDEGEAPFTQLLQLINHGAGPEMLASMTPSNQRPSNFSGERKLCFLKSRHQEYMA